MDSQKRLSTSNAPRNFTERVLGKLFQGHFVDEALRAAEVGIRPQTQDLGRADEGEIADGRTSGSYEGKQRTNSVMSPLVYPILFSIDVIANKRFLQRIFLKWKITF